MHEPNPVFFFFQAEDGIRDPLVTGVQTCALPITGRPARRRGRGRTSAAGRCPARRRAAPPRATAPRSRPARRPPPHRAGARRGDRSPGPSSVRRASSQPPGGRSGVRSERQQVLDQVLLLLWRQAELEEVVVVVDHVGEGGEAPVVEEPALLVCPQALERRGAVAVVGRPVGLEAVDPALRGPVQVPAWLGEQRRDVAARALRLAVEQELAAGGGDGSNEPGAGAGAGATSLTVATLVPRKLATGCRSGASETIAPTFRSRLAQPSSRWPIPGANELSTVEWHRAHWMPTERRLPPESKKPVRPTTAFSLSSASVTAGSSRSIVPCWRACLTESGSASTSTFSPTASAVLGLTPGPTPPSLPPSIALWSCSVSPQKAWSPNVSKRKVCWPSVRSAVASAV